MTAVEEPRWRRLKPDERRAAILTSAGRLFAERSYVDVSTAEIAEAAGVARGLLNHYFGTKRALYLEVVKQASTVPEHAVAALPEGTLDERIDAAVTWFLDSLRESGSTWLDLSSTSVGRDRDVERILVTAENESVDRLLAALDLFRQVREGSSRNCER